MELTEDDGSKKVGTNNFGSTANNDDVHVGTITSRPSNISNSSEKLEKRQDIKNSNNVSN